MKVMTPLSVGTLNMSVMNDWINAALRLLVDGPICEDTALIVKM